MDSNLTKRDGQKRQELLLRHLRWFSPSLFALFVAILFGAAAPAAKADTYDFSMTNGTDTFAFSIPSTSMTPTSFPDSDSFELAPVSYTENNVTESPVPVQFFDTNDGGGLILGGDYGTWIVNQGGDQLFTGDPTAPTGFNLGTFSLTDWGGALESGNFTLTITDPPGSPVPAPEPSSLLLLGVGLLGMSALIAYQQKKQAQILEAKAADSI